ncbi:MAG: hypothetical protein J5I90_11240 [Caldilineales bacterium]|nr:hypothetical protein [Caldilineales bacterium]
MDIYFSDFFEVSPKVLEKYGAFNVSLINDLPLFVDPFLLFNSKKAEYRQLHENILQYLRFLREKSSDVNLDVHLINSWYLFPEVKQNWFGFSKVGNSGAGLRGDFAISLHKNLHAIFSDFGSEKITRSSHLEKLCLIKSGVGRDKISDFTTNLIKEYILEYTQEFAVKNIRQELRQVVAVNKVRFNYETESWESGQYDLPFYNGDYVLLTPKDILTKDEMWINKDDLYSDYHKIPQAISNEQLRAQVNNYFRSVLPKNKRPSREQVISAISSAIGQFPAILDYYIRSKEDDGARAVSVSNDKVTEAETQYIQQIKELSEILRQRSDFYQTSGQTYQEAHSRLTFLKDVIENKDGYRLFYINGNPIERENDLQILYRLTWFASESDVNREVNNGRGPVDFKISRGSKDSTLVEFKLAKNTQLEKNLENQVEIYQAANNTHQAIKVIFYFSNRELNKVNRILRKLGLIGNPDVVLIDARSDNKPSASKARKV